MMIALSTETQERTTDGADSIAHLAIGTEFEDHAVAAIQAGREPRKNFDRLVEFYYPRLMRFLSRQGISKEDRLDVAQETFLEAYKGLRGFRGEARFSTWLFTIASRASSRWWQRQKNSHSRIDEKSEAGAGKAAGNDGSGIHSDPQLTALLAKERRELLRTAVSRLPDQERRCMELRLYQNRSYEEISQILQVAVGTVKAHLFHARERLKDELTESSI